MQALTMYGPGDEQTWGAVLSDRDPRCAEREEWADFVIADLDDAEIQEYAEESQGEKALCSYLLADLRPYVSTEPRARLILQRLHELLSEPLPPNVEADALRRYRNFHEGALS